jgi:rubrerythrin
VPVDGTANNKPSSIEDELALLVAMQRPLGREIRCIECGYGAVSAGPLRCPICGGDAWDFADWRPFRRGGGTSAEPVV